MAERSARTEFVAESNELTLHRRLAPYLDAEIQNRDAEIEELRRQVAGLETQLEAGDETEHQAGEITQEKKEIADGS